jgi:cellulose synthase/poly-beta-1,6-N-acetylglucosamine synthase-like glycosyltransferase
VSFLWYLYLLIQMIIIFYQLVPFLSVVSYGILKLIKARTPFEKRKIITNKSFRFGIIITAHQDTRFIFPAVDSILRQVYRNFHVYIVADDCDPEDLNFPADQLSVLIPPKPLHSKIKSIHYALSHFKDDIDNVIILDADNLIHPQYLLTLNSYFQKGYRAVQCDFQPKNIDTVYARMDAVGDMYNFFLEREIRYRLNMSATIWGAGLAIEKDLYKSIEYKDFLGGFDKKLQTHILQQVDRIGYAKDAILYDEKITTGSSLENQRTRWINSYFKYFSESTTLLWNGIRKFDFNLIYFAVILLRPPLFIVLGVGTLMMTVSFFSSIILSVIWLSVFAAFLLSFVAIILIRSKDVRYLTTLFVFPLFMGRQILALFKMKKARKSFIKTEHNSLTYVSDLLEFKKGR